MKWSQFLNSAADDARTLIAPVKQQVELRKSVHVTQL